MITIETLGGDFLYDVLAKAVDHAPAQFDFNGMKFESRRGETLGDARQRFKDEHGMEVFTREESAANAKAYCDKMISDTKAAIADAKVPTETEMRDAKVPSHESIDELTAYIKSLTDRPHDYGTCCHAMSMAATAAFNYVASKLGVTGFQASCADMDILRRTRGWSWGKILNYEDLLYPQYCDESHFPTIESLLQDNRVKLAEMAAQKLHETGDIAHPNVLAHWRKLAANAA